MNIISCANQYIEESEGIRAGQTDERIVAFTDIDSGEKDGFNDGECYARIRKALAEEITSNPDNWELIGIDYLKKKRGVDSIVIGVWILPAKRKKDFLRNYLALNWNIVKAVLWSI